MKRRAIKSDKILGNAMRPYLPALVVFFALMVIISIVWRMASHEIATQRDAIVKQSTQYIEASLKQRFEIYQDNLRAANSFFASSEYVSREEWTTFVRLLDIPKRYPGMRALGFIKLVNNEDKVKFEKSVQNDGVKEFTIYPDQVRDIYAPLLYFTSFEENQSSELIQAALGFDMYSVKERMSAMQKSAESNSAVLSSEVELLKVKNQESGKGFLMFLPYYKNDMPIETVSQRQAALDGYFYGPFRSDNVFAALMSSPNPSFTFAIYEKNSSSQKLLYQSDANFMNKNFYEVKRSDIAMYGQNWSVVYKVRNDIVPSSVRTRPTIVLLAGFISSFSLAVVMFLLIQRRTRALYYDEQRKLEEAKDDLLSLASHQLRTPATAVKQYISMVKDGFVGDITPEQNKLLQMAYDSNERQLTIVDDLLYVARIDAGKASVRIEKLNIASLITSVIDDQLSVIKSRQQTITFIAPNAPLYVACDAQYVRMIFENLLSNASKYSKHKTEIKIQLKEKNDRVVVSFVDNGVGIAAEDFPNVFQKFSRIPNELTRQIPGSGIGLYLAKQLALLHGGDITFTSQLKKGSTFTVVLPYKKRT